MTRQIPRLLARAPIPLYRAGFGFLLGRRLTMIEHRGRTSGLPRYVVLEVLERDADGLVIVSGYGGRAQWYRNVLAHSGVRVWTGRLRGTRAQALQIPAEDVPLRLEDYRRRHRRSAAALGRTLDIPELGGAGALPVDVASRLPLVRVEFERS